MKPLYLYTDDISESATKRSGDEHNDEDDHDVEAERRRQQSSREQERIAWKREEDPRLDEDRQEEADEAIGRHKMGCIEEAWHGGR